MANEKATTGRTSPVAIQSVKKKTVPRDTPGSDDGVSSGDTGRIVRHPRRVRGCEANR